MRWVPGSFSYSGYWNSAVDVGAFITIKHSVDKDYIFFCFVPSPFEYLVGSLV